MCGTGLWPSEPPHTNAFNLTTREGMAAYIDHIKDDPAKAEQLEQLKQELSELQAEKQKD